MILFAVPQIEISFDVFAIVSGILFVCFFLYKKFGKPVYNLILSMISSYKRIPVIEEKIDSAVAELQTNGGGSLKDLVIDIQEKVTVLDEKQRIFLMDETQGIFETDKQGEFIYVNRTLCRMFGAGERDILGHGWINFLSDRGKVVEKWKESILNEIEFRMVAEFKSATGNDMTMIISAIPIKTPKPENKLVGYIGTISEK